MNKINLVNKEGNRKFVCRCDENHSEYINIKECEIKIDEKGKQYVECPYCKKRYFLEKDKENLSKIKFIYKLYKTVDNILHIERFPVIYINSTYVYYKQGSQEELSRIPLSSLSNSVSYIIKLLEMRKDMKELSRLSHNFEFFFVDMDIEKAELKLNDILKNLNELVRENSLFCTIKSDMSIAKHFYTLANKNHHNVEKEIERYILEYGENSQLLELVKEYKQAVNIKEDENNDDNS